MNCFTHPATPAVGICVACNKAICRACVGRETPRLVCTTCATGRAILGFEYKSEATFAGLPWIHVCTGVDPSTMRPRLARGVIAIGNVAIGGVAVGGLAVGLFAIGGGAVGALFALGGGALGIGLSIGGFALGSVAFGGAAIGFVYAIGGGAIGPAIIDGTRCDDVVREFVLRWVGSSALPPSCR
jgi:hypothetical protein